MLTLILAGGTALFSPLQHGRQLSQTPIGKYFPSTDVQDHANIDLDQKDLEAALGGLSTAEVAASKKIYSQGVYSKPYFTCTLATVGAAVAAGDKLDYTDKTGTLREMTSNVALATTDTNAAFEAKYPKAYPNQGDYQIDASKTISDKAGTVIGTCTGVDNLGGRTLASFSTKSKNYMLLGAKAGGSCPDPVSTKVYANGCPYSTYQPYWDYYCKDASKAGTAGNCNDKGDYSNQFVLAGLDGTKTNLDNFNIDFAVAPASDAAYRKDFIKKTTKFSGAWMYAIREFEDAIDDCSIGDYTANAMSTGPVHAWDEGVAFYVGSSVTHSMFYDATSGLEQAPESAPGSGSKYLAYTLGNKRCKNFKTCGRTGDKASGEAYVNYELWKVFGQGQAALLTGDCAGIVPPKDEAYKLMTVPLVQGTIRYAYKCRNGATCDQKALGELGAFALAVLPQLNKCSATAAATLATAASPGGYTCSGTQCSNPNNDFAAVKAALEGCYPAMGLTCKLVGGLWDGNDLVYEAGAAPCSDASTSSNDGLSTNAIIGIAVGGGAALLFLLCLICLVCKEKAGKPIFTPLAAGKASA